MPQMQGQETSTVFKKLSGLGDDSEREEEVDQDEPPASALHRRRALVPPKLITDGYESATDEIDNQTNHSPNLYVFSCFLYSFLLFHSGVLE